MCFAPGLLLIYRPAPYHAPGLMLPFLSVGKFGAVKLRRQINPTILNLSGCFLPVVFPARKGYNNTALKNAQTSHLVLHRPLAIALWNLSTFHITGQLP